MNLDLKEITFIIVSYKAKKIIYNCFNYLTKFSIIKLLPRCICRNSLTRPLLLDSKKKEYLDLFNKYFLKSFSSRLAEYSDPKINVLSQKKLNEKYTIVSSILLATDKRPEVKIDWRVYTKNKEKPLIRDLIIEGLSLARTQKEEFNSVITSSDNGIEGLFSNLKNFIKN